MIRRFARQRMIVESLRQGDHESHARSVSAWTASPRTAGAAVRTDARQPLTCLCLVF
jgi:hypothetical protein